MNTKAMVFPLDETGSVYVLVDENNRRIGTGSRETCYRMLEILAKSVSAAPKPKPARPAFNQDFNTTPLSAGNVSGNKAAAFPHSFKESSTEHVSDSPAMLLGRSFAGVAAKFRRHSTGR